MRYVWDDLKRTRNFAEHGLDFTEIEAHFAIADALIVPSYPGLDGRPRFLAIGKFTGNMASLVYSRWGRKRFR